MLNPVLHNKNDQTPIYKQIAKSIAKDIEKGAVKKNFVLPSINVFSENYNVARDTVEKAYKKLKQDGYIGSVTGKGYYVLGKKETRLRILLVFNKLSSFKKIIYYSFLKALGNKAVVDLHIHHYSPKHLKKIVEANLGQYNHYVIMPHFEVHTPPRAFKDILKRIPPHELLLLDKYLPGFDDSKSVYQDFRGDISGALGDAVELLDKYHTLSIIFPQHSHHPPGIIEGLEDFCNQYGKKFSVLTNEDEIKPAKSVAYIVIADDDLAALVKKVRKSTLTLGKDIGIISFNESELKELLDITVMSTDFKKMGETAAELILKNEIAQVKNPFVIIKRGSL
ncbi:MAG: GntR family transcriptional regulator [Bacteroidota bacterium]